MGWLLSQFNHARGAPVPEMFISDATQGSLLVAGKVFRGSPAGESCVGEPGEVYTKHQLGERNVDGAAGCTVVMYWRVAAGGEFHCTFAGGAGAGVSFLAEFAFSTDQLQPELTDASEGTSTNGSANVLSGNMFPTAGLGSLVICAAGVTVPDATFAALTTALAGANDDLTYTADTAGTGGNAITIAYVNPGTPLAALAVSVVGNAISVSLATNAASAIISTAQQVMDAVNAHAAASALVTAALAAGNNGTGVVTALAATNLSGGANIAGVMTTDAPAVEDVDLTASATLQPHVWVAHRIDAAAAPPIQIAGHDSVTLESFAVQVMAFTADPVPARGFIPRFW